MRVAPPTYGRSVVAGLLYRGLWWILGGIILMPYLLGMPVFAPLLMVEMRSVGTGSLLGHLMYGLVLGAAYAWLYRPALAGIHAHPGAAREHEEDWRRRRPA
ncbi:MAG: hypothetical protein ACRDFT_05555 [bacterium]